MRACSSQYGAPSIFDRPQNPKFAFRGSPYGHLHEFGPRSTKLTRRLDGGAAEQVEESMSGPPAASSGVKVEIMFLAHLLLATKADRCRLRSC